MNKAKSKILIVDDSKVNLTLLNKSLSLEGYPFDQAMNGFEAIDLLWNNHYDLVLLDIHMPGMDGFEVCRKIRNNPDFINLPVIFLTAQSDRESILEGFRVGAQDYIIKPFDHQELIMRVETHLTLKHSLEQLKTLNASLETEVKARTEELLKAKEKAEESDQLKTAFLQNLSHEIRTPMNGILGFTQLLKRKPDDPSSYAYYVEMIELSGIRMMNTINALVDISKIETGQIFLNRTDFSINNLLMEIMQLHENFAEKRKLSIEIKNHLPPSFRTIHSDYDKLSKILSNLVDNAIKFSYSGSIIIECTKDTDLVNFYIKDSGIGIPKEMHEAIFERFIQANTELSRGHEGIGLGLPISKAYIEVLGGTISLESEPGRGSVFHFTIPANND
ncbi:hybrid sensor histidine kinase/response regulator [Natronoflexus pectinivorans]|uniref:histidine kinase n=1 Tax=Natronoflexus pectinivorans TaxID=682526 RepID=A0A4R2GJH9_9BACT|nr:response regulator [Natronoflexus pectinivorans]TCO08891.1 signal transduction histidine kinase [Natronoflexus pectinivorans]